jgi:RsiW-degrading membrane proteinase PrsW (M82 family)
MTDDPSSAPDRQKPQTTSSAHQLADITGPSDTRRIARNVSERVSQLAGVEKLEGFSVRQFFAVVFARHSTAEVEEYFTVGTLKTTPDIRDVSTAWPKPWVFFKTFVGAVVVYFLFLQAWKEFGNTNLVPGMIIVGSFAVPLSTLIFFVEMNARKNVSLFQVIRLVFVGGILSMILSLLLFRVTASLSLGWLGASVAGLVEEPGKLLVLLLVVGNPRYKYIHNGLLFGAAVGTGFAAFESAGYALWSGLNIPDPDAMSDSIMIRGILSPFAHIAWTGMCGAALWRVKGDRPFTFSMTADPSFLRIFAIAVVMHMIWNSPLYIPFYGKYLLLGAAAWVIILGLIQEGLKQLRAEQAEVVQ